MAGAAVTKTAQQIGVLIGMVSTGTSALRSMIKTSANMVQNLD